MDSDMPELTNDFQSLPADYQHVIRLAQETNKITIAPLQLLVGGWSGAVVYLVSMAWNENQRLEHCQLLVRVVHHRGLQKCAFGTGAEDIAWLFMMLRLIGLALAREALGIKIDPAIAKAHIGDIRIGFNVYARAARPCDGRHGLDPFAS